MAGRFLCASAVNPENVAQCQLLKRRYLHNVILEYDVMHNVTFGNDIMQVLVRSFLLRRRSALRPWHVSLVEAIWDNLSYCVWGDLP